MTSITTYQAVLIQKDQMTQDVVRLVFWTQDPVVFQPGQYFIVHIPSPSGDIKRLYSIASRPSALHTFELLIKQVPGGAASSFLPQLPLFSTVQVDGPAGVFRIQESAAPKRVFMVTGTGFAPIRSYLLSESSLPPSLLLWGVGLYSDVFLLEELLSLKIRVPSFRFCFCFSKEKSVDFIPAYFQNNFRLGRINDVFSHDFSHELNEPNEYYLCGSRTVVESLRLFLLSLGVSKDRVFFEKY